MSSNRLHLHLCHFFFLVTVKTKKGKLTNHSRILDFIFCKQPIRQMLCLKIKHSTNP